MHDITLALNVGVSLAVLEQVKLSKQRLVLLAHGRVLSGSEPGLVQLLLELGDADVLLVFSYVVGPLHYI